MTHKLLIVDDEVLQRGMLAGFLRKQGFEVREASSGEEALEQLAREGADAVLSDQRMPGMGGLELLRRVRERNPEISVLLLTAFGSIENAVQAMREGAFGYITKPVDLDALLPQLRQALEHRRLLGENRVLRERLDRYEQSGLVCESEAMRQVYSLVSRAAPSDSTVLIQGESGTGKEVIARSLHRLSARTEAPFVAVNVGAIPESLLESELFGHEKGAFTGADRQRLGVIERARGGTLFIDEVGDMPAAAQLKLLRVLQERVIERVGGSEEVPVDLRILAATHRELEREVRQGRFRQDLYYRLNVVRIEIPPLRARREDLAPLARYFLRRFCERLGRGELELSARAIDALQAGSWPGNVRELSNVMERAAVLCRGETVGPADLGLSDKGSEATVSWLEREDLPLPRRLELAERDLVLAEIRAQGGNRSAAARRLGLSEKNIRDRLRRWHGDSDGTELA